MLYLFGPGPTLEELFNIVLEPILINNLMRNQINYVHFGSDFFRLQLIEYEPVPAKLTLFLLLL